MEEILLETKKKAKKSGWALLHFRTDILKPENDLLLKKNDNLF